MSSQRLGRIVDCLVSGDGSYRVARCVLPLYRRVATGQQRPAEYGSIFAGCENHGSSGERPAPPSEASLPARLHDQRLLKLSLPPHSEQVAPDRENEIGEERGSSHRGHRAVMSYLGDVMMSHLIVIWATLYHSMAQTRSPLSVVMEHEARFARKTAP